MSITGWRGEIAGSESEEVGRRLGVRACPVCSAEVRVERRGRAGSVRWRRDGGWTCHACDAGGDALALVLAVATGRHRSTSGEDWRRAEDLAVASGLVSREDVRRPTETRSGSRLRRPIDRYPVITVRQQAVAELARRIAERATLAAGESVSFWLRHGARDQALHPDRAAELNSIQWAIYARGGGDLIPWARYHSDEEIERLEKLDPAGLRITATRAEWDAVFAQLRAEVAS